MKIVIKRFNQNKIHYIELFRMAGLHTCMFFIVVKLCENVSVYTTTNYNNLRYVTLYGYCFSETVIMLYLCHFIQKRHLIRILHQKHIFSIEQISCRTYIFIISDLQLIQFLIIVFVNIYLVNSYYHIHQYSLGRSKCFLYLSYFLWDIIMTIELFIYKVLKIL